MWMESRDTIYKIVDCDDEELSQNVKQMVSRDERVIHPELNLLKPVKCAEIVNFSQYFKLLMGEL